MTADRMLSLFALPVLALAAAAQPPQAAPGLQKFDPPLVFAANVGQTAPEVALLAHRGPLTAFLRRDGWLVRLQHIEEIGQHSPLQAEAVDYRCDPANTVVTQLVLGFAWQGASGCLPRGEGALPGHSSWFGDGIEAVGARHSQRARYAELYAGIDAVLQERDGRFSFDLEVAAGADLAAAVLAIDGADRLAIGADGQLQLSTGCGDVALTAPVAWSAGRDGRRKVETVRFRLLDAQRVGFVWDQPDASRRLVVDPGLTYGTYFGASGDDRIYAAAKDQLGRITVVGTTLSSSGMPITTGVNFAGASDVFAAQLDPSRPASQQVVWCTQAGGTSTDQGLDLEIDASGSLVTLAGFTYGGGFPMPLGGARPSFSGVVDGFVLQLTNQGMTRAAGTYYGGSADDYAVALTQDVATGDFAIAGHTFSSNLPLTNPAQAASAGSPDAFVVRFSANLSSIVFATYYGGSMSEGSFNAQNLLGMFGTDVAFGLDGGLALVTRTDSADLPMVAPLRTFAGGTDMGIAHYTSTGGLDFSSYLGGSGFDGPLAVVVDSALRIVVAGYGDSTNYPVQNALQSISGGLNDGLITRLAPAAVGYMVDRSTYIGGNSDDYLWGVDAEVSGAVLYGGYWYSPNFPSTLGSWANFIGSSGIQDGVLGVLAPTLQRHVYGTFFGGASGEAIRSVRSDGRGGMVVGGFAVSSPITGLNGYRSSMAGVRDGVAFVCDLLPVGASRVGTGDSACSGPLFVRADNKPVAATVLTLSTAGAPPSGFGVLCFGPVFAPGIPLPSYGLTSWLDLNLLLGALTWQADSLGYAQLSMSLPLALRNATFGVQPVWVATPGCGAGPLVGSNAVSITVQ